MKASEEEKDTTSDPVKHTLSTPPPVPSTQPTKPAEKPNEMSKESVLKTLKDLFKF